MTRNQHIAHIVATVLAAAAGVVVELLTSTPIGHAGWAPLALVVARYLLTALGAPPVPPVAPAALLLLAIGVSSCGHLPPGVNVPMCALDVIDDVGSALVCNLADHVPLPACVLDGLRKIATDHNCDVSGIVQAVAGNADRNAVATGDYLEAVKAQRARAWLAAQPPDPSVLAPIHDKKKGAK
jgi:hypothetical protein